MKAKEVVLCDFCKERTGKNVCVLCDKDLCAHCGGGLNLTLNNGNDIFLLGGRIFHCSPCKTNLKGIELKGFETDILERAKKQIKAHITLGELQKYEK